MSKEIKFEILNLSILYGKYLMIVKLLFLSRLVKVSFKKTREIFKINAMLVHS